MKKIILLLAIIAFVMSCNVTESIVFDNNMSGEYITSFDMSPMMTYANANKPDSVEKEAKEKMDTTIVFNDFYKTHKDSIDALSDAERARFDKLKDMVMDIHMDEEAGVFNFNMKKPFKSIGDLQSINDQIDEAMGVVKDMGNKDQPAPAQLDELTKTDRVEYAFKDNTFTRFLPDAIKPEAPVEDGMEDDSGAEGADDFAKQFEMQFEEIFAESYYTLIYKFAKKVKSVSNEGAIVSDDGMTVTYKVPWDKIQKDETLMNLNVVLED